MLDFCEDIPSYQKNLQKYFYNFDLYALFTVVNDGESLETLIPKSSMFNAFTISFSWEMMLGHKMAYVHNIVYHQNFNTLYTDN